MIHCDRILTVRTFHVYTHQVHSRTIAVGGSSLAGNGGGCRLEHASADNTSIDIFCTVHHTVRVALYCSTLQK